MIYLTKGAKCNHRRGRVTKEVIIMSYIGDLPYDDVMSLWNHITALSLKNGVFQRAVIILEIV